MTELRSITAIPCHCQLCEWRGVSGDCMPGDDDELLCPKCASYDVVIQYAEHELRPVSEPRA